MASGGRVEEIPDELSCPVCLSEFDQPKVLPCNHVFCKGCLEQWMDKNKLTCPICRIESVFDKAFGIARLPEPMIFKDEREKMTKFLSASHDTGPVSRNCGLCNKVNSATTFCHNCVKNMCEQCANKHLSRKISKAHRLVTISKRTICANHLSELVTVYCMDHSQGLCMICADNDHFGDDVLDIEDHTLVTEKNTKLTHFLRKVMDKDKVLVKHKGDMKKDSRNMLQKYVDVEKQLEASKKLVVDSFDEELIAVRQRKAAELKKLALYEDEIDNIRATRESMASFIKDIQQRNSAPDIVLSADDLPDITTNSVPVLPKLDLPVINDVTNDLIQSIKGLITYSRGGSKLNLPTLFKIANVIPHTDTVRPDTHRESGRVDHYRGEVGHLYRKSSSKKGDTFTGDTSGKTTSDKSPGSVVKPPRHVIPTGREVVSPSSTTSSSSIGDRSGGAVSKVMTSSIGSMGERVSVRQVWEVKVGVTVCDVTWDTEGPGWWVSNEKQKLCKYDMNGTVVTTIKKGMSNKTARICIDTTRNHIVIVDWGKGLLCMTKTGKVVREIPIPGGRCMLGVTYCHHRDMYVVTDTYNDCLWFVSSDSGKVIHKVGSQGSGNTQYNSPYYACHQTISDSECHIIASDSENHCIKVLSPTGEFIRKYGCQGFGDSQLQYPRGVCVDPQGRVVVCDCGNYRVVRYWWDESEKWDVILTKQQLGDERPWCVSMSPDGRHLVVGMDRGTIRGYEVDL